MFHHCTKSQFESESRRPIQHFYMAHCTTVGLFFHHFHDDYCNLCQIQLINS